MEKTNKKINVLAPTVWFPNPHEQSKCIFTKNIIDQLIQSNSNIQYIVISPIPYFYSLKHIKNIFKIIRYKYITKEGYTIFYPRFFKLPYGLFARWRDKNYFKTYKKLIAKEKIHFDLIHVHGLIPDTPIAYKLADYFKKKLVIHIHDSKIPSDSVIKNALFASDKIITVSKFQKKQLIKTFPDLNETKISIIYNGILKRFFQVNPKHHHNNIIRFVSVGRLHPSKEIDWLVQNIEYIMEGIKYSLDIYGFGILEKKIKKIIALNKLSDKVYLKGEIKNEDLPEILANYDYFVSPTTYETFGIANIEALAVGVPLIVSRLDTLEEIIYDKSKVMFFEHKYINSLKNAINKAINKMG